MASPNGTATSNRQPLYTITKLIPERDCIDIEGELYDMKAAEEFGARETAQIMRHAQGVTKFADLFNADEESTVPDEIERAVNGLVEIGFPGIKPAMRGKMPFATKMAISQIFLQAFMRGLTAPNGNPITNQTAAPTPLREALGQIARS